MKKYNKDFFEGLITATILDFEDSEKLPNDFKFNLIEKNDYFSLEIFAPVREILQNSPEGGTYVVDNEYYEDHYSFLPTEQPNNVRVDLVNFLDQFNKNFNYF